MGNQETDMINPIQVEAEFDCPVIVGYINGHAVDGRSKNYFFNVLEILSHTCLVASALLVVTRS